MLNQGSQACHIRLLYLAHYDITYSSPQWSKACTQSFRYKPAVELKKFKRVFDVAKARLPLQHDKCSKQACTTYNNGARLKALAYLYSAVVGGVLQNNACNN